MSKTQTTASKTSTRTRGAKRAPRRSVPWVENGIDYGPARVALDELATWAFDLAAESVADWPEAKQRVKNARRFVKGVTANRNVSCPEEDVAFTASLLVRIFDNDLGLGLGHVIEVLSELGLPTIDVPHPPPTIAPAKASRVGPLRAVARPVAGGFPPRGPRVVAGPCGACELMRFAA
jgi:hypothetical protein